MLDLRTIPFTDLQNLIAMCSDKGKQGNRYFEDQFWILMGVAVQTHELLEMSEYRTDDLFRAVEQMKTIIDENNHLANDHPTMQFLKYSVTAAHDELQRRARRENIKATK